MNWKTGFFVFSIALWTLSAQADNTGLSVEKTDEGVTVKIDGELFTKYVIGEANKPFLWPVIGPNGDPITRAYPMADVEGERKDHPHHRSIWFGHQEVGGFDTWHERLTIEERAQKKPEKLEEMLAVLGATVHREFVEISANGKTATIVTKNDYTDNQGEVMCSDVRTLTFRTDDGGSRIIDFDITFHGGEKPTLLGDAKDAGFSVRVPTSMDVDSEPGGNILNSEGDTDKDAWGKRAKWCSYFGPVGEKGDTMAVTIMNHPKSFRFPTPWHVRSYGLFTANPFGTKSLDKEAEDGSLTLKPGDTLTLRHRVIFHKGDADAKQINASFDEYSK